jgi:hypothetical protein
MKLFSFLIIIAAVLAGSCITVLDPREVNWSWLIPVLLLGAIGLWLSRSFEIDRLFREDLNNFADARESMIHVFGIQDFAEVMSNFAAGERYINRVWSASVDGYVDEVNLYLERALNQFVEAQEHFYELKLKHAAET